MTMSRGSLLTVVLLVGAIPCFGDDRGLILVETLRVAPAFTARDIQGNTHELAIYRGKVLIVNFWATWCAPCVLEMPSLQRAWEQVRDDGIQVLAINMGQSSEDIALFTNKYPVDFPILLDRDVSIADSWSVRGLPTTYVVDVAGCLRLKAIGERDWDDPELLGRVRALR
jgi:peroxiredoxin